MSCRMKRLLFIIFTISNSVLAFANSAGFENDVGDAASSAQAGAVTARAKNPSTSWANPAGMSKIQNKEIQLSVVAEHLEIELKPQNTSATENTDQDFLIPALYYVHPLENLSLGLSINSPYGLSLKWNHPNTDYLVKTSEVKTIYYTPSASFKLSKSVSIGASLNIVHGAGELSKEINTSGVNTLLTNTPTVSTDSFSKIEGDDTALSFNLGLYFDISKNAKLAAVYRSSTKLNLEGDLNITGLSGAMATVFGGTSYSTPTSIELAIPSQFTLGFRRHFGRLAIEVDLDWTRWSSINSFDFKYQESNATRLSILNTGNPIQKDWKDTLNVALGGEFQFNHKYALMFGSRYRPTPVPGNTADVSTPINDLWNIDLGFSFLFKSSRLDLALGHAFSIDRNVNNTVGNNVGATANGEYSLFARVIGASYIYKF